MCIRDRRKNADGNQIVFSDPAAKAAYNDLHTKFTGGVAPTAADIVNLSNLIDAGSINPAEGKLLLDALVRIKTITDGLKGSASHSFWNSHATSSTH